LKPRAVTFDVAGTLVDARWDPRRAVEQASALAGIEVAEGSGDAYGALYAQRLPAFHAANQVSDDAVRDFWIRLDEEWLRGCGQDPSLATALYDAGWELLFGPGSRVFVPFPDALPALQRLGGDGIRLAAISNWDNSLPVVLDMLGWTPFFDLVVPSLVFGHEKPDRQIFDHAIARMGLSPAHALHVGDDPIDDLQGARGAGLRAALVDRSRAESTPPYLRSLDELELAFAWTG